LILIYKIEDIIKINKNTMTKWRFWYKNEDQRNIFVCLYENIRNIILVCDNNIMFLN